MRLTDFSLRSQNEMLRVLEKKEIDDFVEIKYLFAVRQSFDINLYKLKKLHVAQERYFPKMVSALKQLILFYSSFVFVFVLF